MRDEAKEKPGAEPGVRSGAGKGAGTGSGEGSGPAAGKATGPAAARPVAKGAGPAAEEAVVKAVARAAGKGAGPADKLVVRGTAAPRVAKAAAAKAEPANAKAGSVKTDPGKTKPGTAEPGKTKPEKAVAGKAEPAKAGSGGGAMSDAEAEYRELVRLAYFVLPGKRKRIYRLALARRIVERTAGWGPGRGLGRDRGRTRRRTRVLREAMHPSRRRQIGLGPWLRSMPAWLPDPSLTAMLSNLEPRIRLAYVLLYVAGLPRYEVRDQLAELRVPEPWAAIRAAQEQHRTMAGRDADRPAAERGGSPPGAVRRRGTDPFAPPRAGSLRGGRPPIPVSVAVALTVVLSGALVASETGAAGRLFGGTSSAEAHGLRMVYAPSDAWRRAPHSLDVWPARGDLARDKAFVARALGAWAAAAKAGRTGPGGRGDPQLLYAGRVDGRPVALMRRGDRVARYTGADDRLTVVPAGTDPSAPMAVGGGRYLLAPWDRAETLSRVRVVAPDGLTPPLPPRTRCGRGPVLHLENGQGARTVGEFGGARPVVLLHHSPKHAVAPPPKKPAAGAGHAPATTPARPARPAAETAKPAKPARLSKKALAVWERVACLTRPDTGRPLAQATAWEFWSGTLPRGGGRARWVCTGVSTPATGGGAPAPAPATGQAVLLTSKAAQPTGRCDPRRPVAGTWRRSAQGEWHYVAAAARGLTPKAKGPFEVSEVESRLLHAAPPDPARRPNRPVTLTARPSP